MKNLTKITYILLTVKKTPKALNKCIKLPKSKTFVQSFRARGWEIHATATYTGNAWCNQPGCISKICSPFPLALKLLPPVCVYSKCQPDEKEELILSPILYLNVSDKTFLKDST